MSIYTRSGDDGTTGLFGGGRVPKHDVRVEAYGTVDELNAWLGYLRAQGLPPEWDRRLEQVQKDLFALGAYLARDERAPVDRLPAPPQARVAEMENWIDAAVAELAPLRAFLLPTGHPSAAACHIARTVCRRAERRVARLRDQHGAPDWALVYLNRLGDLLFVLARCLNRHHGVPEARWQPGR